MLQWLAWFYFFHDIKIPEVSRRTSHRRRVCHFRWGGVTQNVLLCFNCAAGRLLCLCTTIYICRRHTRMWRICKIWSKNQLFPDRGKTPADTDWVTDEWGWYDEYRRELKISISAFAFCCSISVFSTLMQNSDPPQCCHYNYLCQHLILDLFNSII